MDGSIIPTVNETKELERLHVHCPFGKDAAVNVKQLGHPKRSIDFDSSLNKEKEAVVGDTVPSKRLKFVDKLPSSIIDICQGSHTAVFEGDVLALYGPGCSRDPASPSKALVHVDLVDRHGQLTITVNFANNLIPRFLAKFVVGSNLRITDFIVQRKTTYERRDSEFFLELTAQSSVENTTLVCKCQRLAPNVTIHGLLSSRNPYSVGSVAVIVTRCNQAKGQFELHIKDGDKNDDSAIVSAAIH